MIDVRYDEKLRYVKVVIMDQRYGADSLRCVNRDWIACSV